MRPDLPQLPLQTSFLLLPLSFGLDYVLSAFRYSIIDGSRVIGFLAGRTGIIGISVGKSLEFINRDFNITQVLAFLKFPFEKIWQNTTIYLVIYPLIHILLAGALCLMLIRLPVKMRIIILVFLSILLIMQIIWIFNTDPRIILTTVN